MASYSYEELRGAVYNRIATDEELARVIDDAIRRKRRGWLANLVIDIARTIFGAVIGDIVERVIDWLLGNR